MYVLILTWHALDILYGTIKIITNEENPKCHPVHIYIYIYIYNVI